VTISYSSKSPAQVYVEGKLLFEIEEKLFNAYRDGKSIRIGTVFLRDKKVEFRLSGPDDFFTYKGHRLYGSIMLTRDDANKLFLVRLIPLEKYVSNVIGGEMVDSANYEAKKAQAIAIRTYSVYNIMERRLMPYDLTLEAQAFEPYTNNVRAVTETAGMALTRKGRVIPAFFHTNCGGYTEFAVNVWRTYYHYSKVMECPYCKNSKNFSWKARYTYREIEKKLNSAGHKVQGVYAVHTYSVNPDTHRTTKVIVKAQKKDLILTANAFRIALDSRRLRSTFFSVTNQADGALFTGKGYGHGVGMCQDGALEMAARGKKTDEILHFYYPGTEITKIY
jgi:stage II sporulation protein D